MFDRIRAEIAQDKAIKDALHYKVDEMDIEEAEQLLIDEGKVEPLNWHSIEDHEFIESTLQEPWDI